MTQNSEKSLPPLPKEESSLFKVLTSVADLMPHSYREQCNRLLTYLEK